MRAYGRPPLQVQDGGVRPPPKDRERCRSQGSDAKQSRRILPSRQGTPGGARGCACWSVTAQEQQPRRYPTGDKKPRDLLEIAEKVDYSQNSRFRAKDGKTNSRDNTFSSPKARALQECYGSPTPSRSPAHVKSMRIWVIFSRPVIVAHKLT